jgi:hypothetical protein
LALFGLKLHVSPPSGQIYSQGRQLSRNISFFKGLERLQRVAAELLVAGYSGQENLEAKNDKIQIIIFQTDRRKR